jgi:hypothetical protein
MASATLIEAVDRLSTIAESIFSVPSSEELAALFSVGFLTPLTIYLIAFCVGSLVNFWRSRS